MNSSVLAFVMIVMHTAVLYVDAGVREECQEHLPSLHPVIVKDDVRRFELDLNEYGDTSRDEESLIKLLQAHLPLLKHDKLTSLVQELSMVEESYEYSYRYEVANGQASSYFVGIAYREVEPKKIAFLVRESHVQLAVPQVYKFWKEHREEELKIGPFTRRKIVHDDDKCTQRHLEEHELSHIANVVHAKLITTQAFILTPSTHRQEKLSSFSSQSSIDPL